MVWLWLFRNRFALVGPSVCSVLIVVGYFLSPHGAAIGIEVFNRALGLVALWAAVLGGRAYLQRLAEIRQQQEALTRLNGTLEQRVAERTAELSEQQQRLQAVVDTAVEGIITINERGIVDSMNAAAERMFGYRADEVIGRNVSLLMPSPYREQHDGYIARYRETGHAKIIGIGREFAGQRKDGTMFPLDLAVSEVKLGDRRIFTGLVRDLTERKRLEAAVTSSAEQERGRIARDLHDGLGQELGGALFLGNLLQRDLKERGAAEAERAAQIHTLVEKALADAREISRGLYPVPPEPDGLMTALQNLADRVTRDGRIECIFDADSAVLLEDQTTATHLYRIAQEAVNNALKHSGTSRIDIRLAATAHSLEISVRDHGTGWPQNPPASGGLGLQTMKHRAQLVGGRLTAQDVPDGGGVLVSCSVARVWRGKTESVSGTERGEKKD
jgi:PAS domain S-box-containing protein